MIDPVLDGLDVPVEHGGVRGDALTVGLAHHGQPLVAVGLALDDLVAGLLREDLGPAPGHRVEPRLLELGQDLLHGHAVEPMEEEDLHRGEGLDVDVRAHLLDAPHHVGEVREGQVGVQASHDVHFAHGLRQPRHVGEDVVERHGVGPRLVLLRGEGAEVAGGHAHVGVVDVGVPHEVAGVAVPLSRTWLARLPRPGGRGCDRERPRPRKERRRPARTLSRIDSRPRSRIWKLFREGANSGSPKGLAGTRSDDGDGARSGLAFEDEHSSYQPPRPYTARVLSPLAPDLPPPGLRSGQLLPGPHPRLPGVDVRAVLPGHPAPGRLMGERRSI